MNQEHVSLPHSSRPLKEGAVRVRDVDPESHVEVIVTLKGPPLPEPDPAAPMTSRDLEEYGASPEDVAKVRAGLERYGLEVQDVSRAARSMTVSGTASQMEAAFHPGLGIYRTEDQGEYRGREQDIQVPADLAEQITGVFDFDERRVARRGTGATAAAPPAVGNPLGVGDVEARYAFPPGECAGQRIGIAEFGGAYFPRDLAAYCEANGKPQPNVHVAHAGLAPLTEAQVRALPEAERKIALDETGEVMMDVQLVAGLCPAAEVTVYFAHFTQGGWVRLLNKVIDAGPDAPTILSVSWGTPEDSPEWSRAAILEINQRLQAAALMGITICVAAGDDGSGDGLQDGRAHVDFPASSPYVLGVGGTMIEDGAEVVWQQPPGWREGGGGATGGGVSEVFARPAWQAAVDVEQKNPGGMAGRIVPDVAALAGPPFYELVFADRPAPNGGTSASAPVWASALARARAVTGEAAAFFTPVLYQSEPGGAPRGENVCTDVTVGQNESSPSPAYGYEAKPGYDAPSGWGVPIVDRL